MKETDSVYQLALVIAYVLAFMGVLEVWPATLHFHHADFKVSLLWEVPIRVGVMPFLVGALLSAICKRQERLPIVAFAIAPPITFLLVGVLQEAGFDWWEIVISIVAGACSVAGAWTVSHLSLRRSAVSTSQ
jgi:hypothetical protein